MLYQYKYRFCRYPVGVGEVNQGTLIPPILENSFYYIIEIFRNLSYDKFKLAESEK
jgi:hypothetical protein